MKAKLKRLQRLERIRAIAKREAATRVAEAEATFAQLDNLASRSRSLAASYTGGKSTQDGADLQGFTAFAAGMEAVALATAQDARRAYMAADARMAELTMAERRRDSVEQRAKSTMRDMARHNEPGFHGARPRTGTLLE